MADEVVIIFKADTGDLDKAVGKIEKLTKLQADLRKEVSATYSNKQLDAANDKLEEQLETVVKLGAGFKAVDKGATASAKAVEGIGTAAEAATEKVTQLTDATDGVKKSAKETGDVMRTLATSAKALDGMVTGMKAAEFSFNAAQKALGVFSLESKRLEAISKQTGEAITALSSAQKLCSEAGKEGTTAFKIASAAQSAYTMVVGTSTGALKVFKLALAATGIGLLVIALGELVANWEELSNWVIKSTVGAEKFGQVFGDLKAKLAGVGEVFKLVFSNIGKTMAAAAKLDFDGIKEIWKDFGKQARAEYEEGYANSKSNDALQTALKNAARELKIAEITGEGIYKAKKKYLELQIQDLKRHNADVELLQAELTTLIKQEAEKQQQILKEKRKEKLSDEIAGIERSLLYVAEGSERELQLKIALLNKTKELKLVDIANTKAHENERLLIIEQAAKEISDLRIAFSEAAADREYEVTVSGLKATIAATNELEQANLQAKLELIDREAGAEIAARTKGLTNEKEILAIGNQVEQETINKILTAYVEYYEKLKQMRLADVADKLAKAAQAKDAVVNNKSSTPEQKATATTDYNAAEKAAAAEKIQIVNDTYNAELAAHKNFNRSTTELEKQHASELLNINKGKNEKLTDQDVETAEQKKERQKAELAAAIDAAQQLSDAAFGIIQQQFEAQTNSQLAQLDKQKEAELSNKNLTEAQKDAINVKYAKKEAEIKRKAFQRQKTASIIQAVINTALAVVNAMTSGDGYTAAIRAAVAGALGAVQIAVIASQPTPQFEKGGPVVLGGGRLNDGHLYGRSHRQGGILINAQGGEYIWDIPTVKKHGDLIRAAHENRLEDLVMHKYIVPAMSRTLQPVARPDAYDDFMLRSTIKQGHEKDRRNAEYIAAKVSEAVSATVYNQNRYR